MNIKQWLRADYLPIPLIALMALTRFHHFGDFLHLPDASLAVFFFAGFYRKKALLVFLMALAAFIDYVAIANGTSSFCVSPAYVFLVPTYAAMWLAGRYCSAFNAEKISALSLQLGIAALATSTAFAISNGSFYWLSGRYTDLSWGQYIARVAQYYPLYAGCALLYIVAGYAIMTAVKSLPTVSASHKEV
ncbi:MAG: hypothetical protein Q7U38_02510 [Methylobacter sp.]|nr:hypothetical protein [Methylobacter sp.]MDP2100426.1 hypothetical protein [Methylobacter sp.]MDP2427666.1 hypothetical protein [Methylobacter sp.]MDP3054082.1 hypothetical protein [Methylobacter sp.]MDP3362560.1 hypothetical protein [Methylobacter sp.]